MRDKIQLPDQEQILILPAYVDPRVPGTVAPWDVVKPEPMTPEQRAHTVRQMNDMHNMYENMRNAAQNANIPGVWPLGGLFR